MNCIRCSLSVVILPCHLQASAFCTRILCHNKKLSYCKQTVLNRQCTQSNNSNFYGGERGGVFNGGGSIWGTSGGGRCHKQKFHGGGIVFHPEETFVALLVVTAQQLLHVPYSSKLHVSYQQLMFWYALLVWNNLSITNLTLHRTYSTVL